MPTITLTNEECRKVIDELATCKPNSHLDAFRLKLQHAVATDDTFDGDGDMSDDEADKSLSLAGEILGAKDFREKCLIGLRANTQSNELIEDADRRAIEASRHDEDEADLEDADFDDLDNELLRAAPERSAVEKKRSKMTRS
jgi:hypothetical protein